MTVKKDNPFIVALVSGFYPLVFYFSNNFYSVNSWQHLGYFTLFFIGIPLVIYPSLYYGFKRHKKLAPYATHLLFVLLIFGTAVLMSHAMYLMMKKKVLLGTLILSVLLSLKMRHALKKFMILILIMAFLSLAKVFLILYEQVQPLEWAVLPDGIEEVVFVTKPNVYLIVPDGYVSPGTMAAEPYAYDSGLYNWLEGQGFKVYEHFRSNYPASLTSTASMFAMKQHRFGSRIFNELEMPHARNIISGDNAVIRIFKNNGYRTSLIVKDEYFQQNFCPQWYDHRNISLSEIPYFSDNESVVKDVLSGLKEAMNKSDTAPNFFFIQKLLPHHVNFTKPLPEMREWYLERIEESNDWQKETIAYISENDPNAIVIVLADHGGWLGNGSLAYMYSENDPVSRNSVFSTLAAIKWSGNLPEGFDNNLTTNVNLFRVLFATLSKNETYLQHLEDNSSYNLHIENPFYKSVKQVIDNDGNHVYN